MSTELSVAINVCMKESFNIDYYSISIKILIIFFPMLNLGEPTFLICIDTIELKIRNITNTLVAIY